MTANSQWTEKTSPKFTSREAAHAHARMLGHKYTVLSREMKVYAYSYKPDRDYMEWFPIQGRKFIGTYVGNKQITWRKSLLGHP